MKISTSSIAAFCLLIPTASADYLDDSNRMVPGDAPPDQDPALPPVQLLTVQAVQDLTATTDGVCAAEQVLDFPSNGSNIKGGGGRPGDDFFLFSARSDHLMEQTFHLPQGKAIGAQLEFCVPLEAVLFGEVRDGNTLEDGAFVSLQLSINGVDVGDEFSIFEGFQDDCVTIDYSFPPIDGSQFELRLRVTNDVPSGDGAIAVDLDNGNIKLNFDCGNGGALNDPHFELFSGRWYDFMGACDLTLLHAPSFANGMALHVDIRTKIRYWYSYIESAVIKIGEDTLEVSSWGGYAVNGVNAPTLEETGVSIGGFPISHNQPQKNVHVFTIVLDAATQESIEVKTFKDMVSVLVHHADHTRFEGCLGMMGDLKGNMLGRDGATIIEDPNEFAAEWQVRDAEPMLFQVKAGPQYPDACQLPSVGLKETRLLEESSISQQDAEEACAHWDASIRSGCIHDVIATRDVGLAGAF